VSDLSANTSARVIRGSVAPAHEFPTISKPVDPIVAITEERGKDYGHPLDHFTAESRLYAILREYRVQAVREGKGPLDPAVEHCFDHVARWILDKLVRACKSPLKQDNWDDIQGYARTFLMSVKEHGRRKLEDAP
jgi:hypothetical protein